MSIRSTYPKSRYIFPDANILVLLIAGQVRPNLLPQLSPGNYRFEIDDFEVLSRLINEFEAIITTPYILAEVNSLLSKLDVNSMVECRAKLAEYILLMESRYTEPKDLASNSRFPDFGIADVSILFASDQSLIVTQDGSLLSLLRNNCDVQDYTAIKQLIAKS